MNIFLTLLGCALGLWLDVLLYRWLRKRWPTVAVLLALAWAASWLVQLYRIYNRRTL